MKPTSVHIPHFIPSANLMRNLLTVALIGAAITVTGLFFVPERVAPNILLAAYYLLGLGLAGAIFVALHYVSNAGWSTAIRRVPESMIHVLPAAGVMMILLFPAIHILYEWSHESAVAADHLLQVKSFWLNVPFFAGRTVFYLVLWLLLAFAIVRTSRKQDAVPDLALTARNTKLSAIFLVTTGMTFVLASMDWIMSLEPHWYSTIFGVYNLAGVFLSGLAAITILVILLKRMGPFRTIVNEDHLHNLGKLLFAFSTFWMYIWFSQYLLIWYANIPEEVTYLVHRERGSWLIFTVVNVLFNWAIPFIVLLPSWTKKNEGILFKICIVLLLGHWIDLFWMILPPFMPDAPVVNIWEIGTFGGMIAGFFWLTFRSLAGARVVPVNDPMLVESLQEH